MPLIGIDAVTFGVVDMEAARRFLRDWGLSEGEGDTFATLDGTQVFLRSADDRELPQAFEDSPTLREVIWGVERAEDLDHIAALLARMSVAAARKDGTIRCIDPSGLGIGFRISRHRHVPGEPVAVNSPNAPMRINKRGPSYERATPIAIGHVVLFSGRWSEARKFYLDLGFRISDEYPGHGVFLRCRGEGDHHNLFLLNRPDKSGLNHVAFGVRDIHELFGGGLAMSRKGWDTDIGPGRHPISSAYFWYFKSPLGASIEYFADEDYVTEAWQPREHQIRPEMFAEWAITRGLDGHTRREKR